MFDSLTAPASTMPEPGSAQLSACLTRMLDEIDYGRLLVGAGRSTLGGHGSSSGQRGW